MHVVGKDIIRFHAVYWPAFLMAAMLPVPKQVWAHGWFLMDQAKMSKSNGNVVKPRPIVDVLGLDALRYFLLRDTVFGQDGNFSYDALGHALQQRSSQRPGQSGQPHRRADREKFRRKDSQAGHAPAARQRARQTSAGSYRRSPRAIQQSRFLESSGTNLVVIAAADKYLTTEQPWALSDSEADQQRKATILYTTAEVLRVVTALTHPVLPQSTKKIWTLLGQQGPLGLRNLDGLRWGQLKPGTTLGKSQALFPRIDKAEAMERIEAMDNEEQKKHRHPRQHQRRRGTRADTGGSRRSPAAAPEASEKIGIEDFAKVEMRVGQVKTAERIVGADKLLKLTVDIGTEVRQICAGIAQYYEPESLIGRKVVVVVNLAPRKLRGVESNGMIVAASVGPEGRPVLAGFAEDVEVGARLK